MVPDYNINCMEAALIRLGRSERVSSAQYLDYSGPIRVFQFKLGNELQLIFPPVGKSSQAGSQSEL